MTPKSLYSLRFPLSLLLTCLYQWMFWQEKMGLNVILFSGLLVALVLYMHPEARSNRRVWTTTAGTLLTAILVVVYNSGIASIVHLGSLLVFMGYVHGPQLRTVGAAFLQSLSSYWHLRLHLGQLWKTWVHDRPIMAKVMAYGKLIVLPLLCVLAFAVLYLGANPRLVDLYFSGLTWLGELLGNFSWLWLLFCLGGWLMIMGILFRSPNAELQAGEAGRSDLLSRTRSKQKEEKKSFRMLSLKQEYRMGVMTFALLNALLLVNNLVDVNWIWFGFEPEPDLNLTQFVHEGTYFLIISILLSMLLVLYYFRANLNFYPSARLLRILTHTWIAQNLVLVVSVVLRNYHYISYWGLAYKRIGVFFFLLAVIFGLGTLFLKVRDRMSTFYLIRLNGWSIYGVFILLTLVNWDPFITRYNLQHAEQHIELDRGFLLQMSHKTLPILLENKAIFDAEVDVRSDHHTYWLMNKVDEFQQRQAEYSWWSWNWADAKVEAYLDENL